MRALYFTVVPLGATGNGGSICCRNHVARLRADPAIELFAMVAGPFTTKEGTDAFFASLDVPYHFLPFRDGNFHYEVDSLLSIADFSIKAVFQFPWELQALNQEHIEEGIAWAIRGYSIDVLVIDYHPSTLFLRLPRTDVRTALIGLAREGDFYKDLIRHGQTHHGSLTSGISLARLKRWERRTDAAVDQLIFIAPSDLPKHRTRNPPTYITPYLDPPPDRWTYLATNRVFFVGAIGHFPNRLAIEWLTRRLAPNLLSSESDVRITIVGANEADIPDSHRHPNLELLGPADGETVSRLFRTSDLMICPVEIEYGVEFKALEALAYGTPLLASWQTMSRFPHLQGVPTIDLRDPAAAASLIVGLLENPDRLRGFAFAQQQQQASFIQGQNAVWSRNLGRCWDNKPIPTLGGSCAKLMSSLKMSVKNLLRPHIEGILRRLPVSRVAFAERDALAAQLEELVPARPRAHEAAKRVGPKSQMSEQVGSPISAVQQNKQFALSYFEDFANRLDDAILHNRVEDSIDRNGPGIKEINHDGDRGTLAILSESYHDLRVEVRDVLAEGDKVVCRNVWTATHTETGRRMEFHGFVLWRLQDGKIAERWATVTPPTELAAEGPAW